MTAAICMQLDADTADFELRQTAATDRHIDDAARTFLRSSAGLLLGVWHGTRPDPAATGFIQQSLLHRDVA